MTTVNIHKAKTELSKLIKLAQAGEEVIIARGSEAVVELKPIGTGASTVTKRLRQPGSMKHLLGTIPDDIWFEPLPEDELKLWEGGE